MRGFIHGPASRRVRTKAASASRQGLPIHSASGLVDQFFLKGASMACVVNGLDQCLAHHRSGTGTAIKTVSLDHVDDRPHSASFLPDHHTPGVLEFHFEEALERFPSLSLSCNRKKLFRCPSGFQRGTRKQESPSSELASIRNASHIGAEQKYLCPVSRYSSPVPDDCCKLRRGWCCCEHRTHPVFRS